MDEEDYLRQAIAAARRGIEAGQSPFGAVVVAGGRVVAAAHNAVLLENDPTAHAEVRAIRQAGRELGTIDLSGGVIFSTCEPCPMCFGAIHWSRIRRIVFGAGIADARAAGFSELPLSNLVLRDLAGSPLEIQGGLLREECSALFAEWRRRPGARAY